VKEQPKDEVIEKPDELEIEAARRKLSDE